VTEISRAACFYRATTEIFGMRIRTIEKNERQIEEYGMLVYEARESV